MKFYKTVEFEASVESPDEAEQFFQLWLKYQRWKAPMSINDISYTVRQAKESPPESV